MSSASINDSGSAVNKNEVELYRRLGEMGQLVFQGLIFNDTELLINLIRTRSGLFRLNLSLNRVVRLLPRSITPHRRDHIIYVFLAGIERRLYENGYCSSGRFIKTLTGNYRAAVEDTKQSIISEGFVIDICDVSNREELEAATPLKSVSDFEYSTLYEKLMDTWGNPRQKEAAKRMEHLLKSIHNFLSKDKIGKDFKRERRGREEPLPMYVRNELHHPTKGDLFETEAFQSDKRIGYAIMETWLDKPV